MIANYIRDLYFFTLCEKYKIEELTCMIISGQVLIRPKWEARVKWRDYEHTEMSVQKFFETFNDK